MERINKYILRSCLILLLVANTATASEPEESSTFDFSLGWFSDESESEHEPQTGLEPQTELEAQRDVDQQSYGGQRVTIAEPYIEMHTGPGRGYPVFFVVKRGDVIEVIKRKTGWFKVAVINKRSTEDQMGWVRRSALEKTLAPDGQQVAITEPRYDDFTSRQWELGVLAGEFESTTVGSMYLGYLFTKNLSAELSVSQVLGDYSESLLANINLVHQPFPTWPVSPFFTLGTGVIHTEPKTSLVQSDDRTDQTANYGVGVRIYVTERYFIRLEYKDYVVFTDRNENDTVDEWKIGLSVFF